MTISDGGERVNVEIVMIMIMMMMMMMNEPINTTITTMNITNNIPQHLAWCKSLLHHQSSMYLMLTLVHSTIYLLPYVS